MEVVIAILIMVLFACVLIVKYIRDQANRIDIIEEDILTHDAVVDKVVKRLAEFMQEDTYSGKDDIEWKVNYKRRLRFEKAMINCVYGIDQDKLIVKELIVSILMEIFPTIEDLYKVYPLNSYAIEPWWQFEILMERLWPTYKKNSLNYLFDQYNWAVTKYNIEDGSVPVYNVTTDQLQEAYAAEIISPLTFREALSVVATLIYSEYKGMGVVDTLRTMNIDGFNIGTSGSIMNTNLDDNALDWRAPRSVWVYYQGKFVHMQFLTFHSEQEIRRVVQLIARYNNPGPLTEKRGYLVNTMYDKSRVLALRPPASEYWACFVRKFVLSVKTLTGLVDPVKRNPATGETILDANGEPIHKYKNAQLPYNLIRLLMRGQVTTAFTGRQGSGKTTLMVAAIAEVDGRFTIRVLEMAPEMYLRELYPQRNILSVQETNTVTAAMLQDALKKSDAALSIVGEVATDIIAARMLQMAQVASIFTIFSHHANRTVDLVHAITNSVVAASGGTVSPSTIEPQVIDAIHVDVHLDYFTNGDRYIERVTEIQRLDSQPYPSQRPGESNEDYRLRLDKEYYVRRTDRQMFTTQDVIRFNPATYTYDVARDAKGKPIFFSVELTKHIFSRIEKEDQQYWRNFVLENWGGKTA